MTIKDLKVLMEQKIELIQKQLNLIKKREEVRFNQDIEKAKKFDEYTKEIKKIDESIEKINDTCEKYNSILEVKARDLAKELKEVFEKEEPNSYPGIGYQCCGHYEERGSETCKWMSFVGEKIMRLGIYNLEYLLICEETNEDLRNDMQFTYGYFNVNIETILHRTHYLRYYNLISEACWNAVAQKLKHEKIISLTGERKNLLMQKLEILQNEELRNKEIKSLTEEIKQLEKQTEALSDPFEINID